ncbi:HAD family hydrolase [Nonomuraea sp. NPDC001684]
MFLASRGITAPEGGPGDEHGAATVRGLGMAKDALFVEHVAQHGVAAFPSTVALVRELRRRGCRTAVVSASRHCRLVVTSAGLIGLFDVVVGGDDAARLGLPGKPDPALFLEAARRLEVAAGEAAVVEDALPGVEAGRRGGFGLVVGLDRGGSQEAAMRGAGADVVVRERAARSWTAPCPTLTLAGVWRPGPGVHVEERGCSQPVRRVPSPGGPSRPSRGSAARRPHRGRRGRTRIRRDLGS